MAPTADRPLSNTAEVAGEPAGAQASPEFGTVAAAGRPSGVEPGRVDTRGRGRPGLRPRRTAGDRGYSSPPVRSRLRRRRIEPVIPTCEDQPHQVDFDKSAYRERNKVERLIGRLKQYRRIATCYGKLAANYLAMVTLGMDHALAHMTLQRRPRAAAAR